MRLLELVVLLLMLATLAMIIKSVKLAK